MHEKTGHCATTVTVECIKYPEMNWSYGTLSIRTVSCVYLFEEVVSGVVDELLQHLRPAHTGSRPPSLGVTSLQDLK